MPCCGCGCSEVGCWQSQIRPACPPDSWVLTVSPFFSEDLIISSSPDPRRPLPRTVCETVGAKGPLGKSWNLNRVFTNFVYHNLSLLYPFSLWAFSQLTELPIIFLEVCLTGDSLPVIEGRHSFSLFSQVFSHLPGSADVFTVWEVIRILIFYFSLISLSDLWISLQSTLWHSPWRRKSVLIFLGLGHLSLFEFHDQVKREAFGSLEFEEM